MRALALAIALAGCGSAPPPAPDPIVPTTHRDPPAHVPPPAERAETGTPVALAASAGDEQVRELVVALVLGLRDQDAEAMAALFAPQVFFTATLRPGRTPASAATGALVAQLLATARIAQARRDARFEELVEPGSIQVDPISTLFPDALPRELEPGDRVVRFTTTAAGRRTLAGLAQEGVVSLVVRPGDGARIVAR